MTYFHLKNNLKITNENRMKNMLRRIEKIYVYILPVENPNRC